MKLMNKETGEASDVDVNLDKDEGIGGTTAEACLVFSRCLVVDRSLQRVNM